MKEKLPKIYANRIQKEINNNEKIYNSSKISKVSQQEQKTVKEISRPSVKSKINKMFASKKYIYKIPVKIKLKESDNEITTKIIGMNKKQIITIDNKLIEIEQIEDIKINEEKE